MLAVRLDPEMEARLGRLADATGRTKTFYARAALTEYIADLEDYYLAEQRMKAFIPGDGISLDDVAAELGLDD